MDKNIGEQLNKAYEAYRQACMDRDHAVKELQQKTENYMQQIREQQEKIELQNSIIAKLKSQLAALNANRGSAHPYIMMHEDIETFNLPFSQLSEKLNIAKQREKLLKEQLESESMKLKQLEDKSNQKERKLLSVISNQEDKIRNLKSKLKELNEAQKSIQMPIYKREVKSRKVVPDNPELSLGISGISPMAERENLETIFQDMKEECHRICMLAEEQTDQLIKFKIKPEPETEIQFSMPIQCTDKTDEQAEELFKPRVIKDINRGASCITSITPRGVGQDEDNNSVESLSKFNVKFPPTDNDSAFLQSTQEKPTVSCTGIAENMLQDHHFNLEHRDRAANLSKLEPNSFEAHGIDLMTSALQSLTTVDKTNPSDHANVPIENIHDKPCLKTTDSGFTFVPKHTNQGVPEAIFSLETAGTTVRGPHQIIWQPQDNDLLAQAYADSELNQCRICEFCREVFPPSPTSKEDFLRHLNSHFKVQS
ncbi:TRAF family member-associated NF-kappa-B activator isoform X1 [Pipra filicauda]|uniref:TRAF family member-associated NF-kappa-B activator isoform X1 n=2 Tax=Pipra filicauda TaxID=649802 RepID=A0A6J2HQC0_9PASS|nr:TRAF family member-associated NF-kappa-B activator isoform X1 [Pipra filicauda]XP_027589973.1 TRAF family member-associated NF-kappa-B activator isoform X1 [Pipra filicauda]XP_029815716.1 TRAF family member-associated NF-kappa-B activator [Manacus vitellinus]XP_029815717.1 TRAF family member-associated NF-kappa-B activator [Manacus vitellinus]XP_029815718.1 TRAF family member-associated NF-kappa-B activator [Manacus vitellinus]XP_051643627.1 TRAF family member-associated NF-kappa-B activato